MIGSAGRSWRPLEDTAVTAQLLYFAREDGQAWRRSVDFYNEGAFIWLDVDTLIREKSKGKKSLDDFLKLFFGGANGLQKPAVRPYTLDDVIGALNQVQPHDWRSLLIERASLDGMDVDLGHIDLPALLRCRAL